MSKGMTKKITQVPIEDDLLARIDETVEALDTSRAAFIREACQLRLKSLEAKKLDRRYMAGYRKIPEDTAWAEAGSTLLSRILPQEEW